MPYVSHIIYLAGSSLFQFIISILIIIKNQNFWTFFVNLPKFYKLTFVKSTCQHVLIIGGLPAFFWIVFFHPVKFTKSAMTIFDTIH